MIKEFLDKKPMIHEGTFIAENSTIVGDVEIGKDSSIWFGAVIRGDENSIKIGEGSNVQDNSIIHVDEHKVTIGNFVTVGHGAILHGCDIEDEVLIGMGATVLSGAKIGKNTIIGAGALVKENANIPEGVLCVGIPAKVVRILNQEERNGLKEHSIEYIKLSKKYK
ncbi:MULTISPECIES: gamma carbonic anhydrase family protein [Clostridium]|jgi:carbonic anhydrase/acetyltransferase-like protein (isoleucine patch superfamily)|uniref:Hexapeptide repeat-containing transferase n=2 Tax=Clostridium intestinale TaxID=36845 RepID=U2NLM6_9CLOT|nr:MULTISPECIES: gamma carbonic anhydrase family protein [Clostridium]ERK30033.1 hexapeptide repeat-containing transferase [Clostridium intestinale URNW]WRY52415.1 gamma carbonic anhydrase family protein [Clostridium intestinale]SHH42143.1 Carbonic anhydrase or acetyltransferase, isoleucine patch superfamily [Clostridium intestinale DSM 6191]